MAAGPGPFHRAAWVACPRPEPAAPWRLWCLPHAGGGASSWLPWGPALSGIAEVAALRPPGREMRLMEPPATRAAALAEGLFAEMSPYLDRPYVLAGHSVGAVIAFELARLARARGRPAPAALIVSGARSPGTPRRESDLHPLPEAEFVTALDERYGGIPPAVRSQPELLALLLPLMRADVSVYETYALRPEAPLDCPILALGGRTDVHVTEDDVLAWRTHTRGRFEAQFFPGGHFFIQSDFGPAADCVKHFLSRLSEGLFF